MAEKRDYYEVLGVDRGADDATLKKAYRKLVKQRIGQAEKRQIGIHSLSLQLFL